GLPSGFVLANAVISDSLQRPYAEVKGELLIKGCRFENRVGLPYAMFERRVRIVECVFEDDLDLAGCQATDLWFAPDLSLEASAQEGMCTFRGGVDLLDSQVLRNLVLDNAQFASRERIVRLNGARVEGGLFCQRAVFEGEVDFTSLYVRYGVSWN